MQSSISRRSVLNYIGIGVLLVGMVTAEFIYWRSLGRPSQDDDDASLDSPYGSKVYQQDVERYVGTFGLLMDEWSRAAASLGEPKPLAITIVVVSIVVSGGCFLSASRMPRE